MRRNGWIVTTCFIAGCFSPSGADDTETDAGSGSTASTDGGPGPADTEDASITASTGTPSDSSGGTAPTTTTPGDTTADDSSGDTSTAACSDDAPCSAGEYCVEGQCLMPPDGMVAVPAGPFQMGCNEAEDVDCQDDEYPYHEVTLSAFAIDRTEVTVAQYTACVDAGGCPAPSPVNGFCNYGDASLADYPINCVNWFAAEAYCTWADKRLPTEAEWEKAARGVDGDLYPWGNDPATCLQCVFSDCKTTGDEVVGSKPAGASPYGALDMAGNVWEWVADWYDPAYYVSTPDTDPPGPASGSRRILRGGASNYGGAAMRASFRGVDFEAPSPNDTHDGIGFRCAATPGA